MTEPAPAPQAPPPAPAERPGHVTAAGIIHIVAGALGLLFGLLIVIFAALFGGAAGGIADQFGRDMAGALGGIFLVLALVVIAFAALILVTGIKILSGRPWARITGIVIGVLGVIFSLGGMAGEEGNVVLNLVFAVAWAYAVWALFAHKAWFEARRTLV
jgi:membrane protease YdiL (CAAX protease family)